MKLQITQPKVNALFTSGEKLLLAVLFLSAIDIKFYSMHLMILTLILYCLMKGKLSVSNGTLPMLLLTVSLLFFGDGATQDLTAIVKCAVWAPAFVLGYNLINDSADGETAEQRAMALLRLFALGFFVHYTLNAIINFGVTDLGRNTLDFWSGQSMTATGQAALACIPSGWFMAKLVHAKSWRSRILPLLGLAVIMYYNLTLGTRFLLLLFIVLVVVAVLYTLLTENNSRRKRNSLLAIIILCILVLILYGTNAWNIQELIEESMLSQRYENSDMSIVEDSRWDLRAEYLKRMPDYLWGGGHIFREVGSYAHDIFLDTYSNAGLIALLAVIAIIWDSFSKLFRLLRLSCLKLSTKLSFLCIYTAILLEFCVEPILDGTPWLLMAFCFLHGTTSRLLTYTAVPK